MRSLVNYWRGLGRRVVSFLDDGTGTATPNAVLANRIIKFIFFRACEWAKSSKSCNLIGSALKLL